MALLADVRATHTYRAPVWYSVPTAHLHTHILSASDLQISASGIHTTASILTIYVQKTWDPKQASHKTENTENEENADIVVGSRYIKGISVLHWPLSRLLLSIFANYYVKLVTGFKVNDSTGGFNGYNFKALNSILKNKIDFEGYAFQIQMKFIGYKIGFKIIEIPIIFKDREIGESKMSFKIFGEAFLGIIWMKFKSFFQGFKN